MKKIFLLILLFLFIEVFWTQSISNVSTGNVKEIRKETKAPPTLYGPNAYIPRPEIDRAYVTVGAGGSLSGAYNTDITPFGTYWHDSRDQVLYTAADLSAGSIDGIVSVGFNVGAASTQVMNGFNISMGHTTAASLSGGWVADPLTNVYSGTWTASAGWNDIPVYFDWDGTSNIVVEVCFDNTSYTSNSTVYYDSYPGMHADAYSDYVAGCTHDWERDVIGRPQTRFGYVPTSPPHLLISPYSYNFGKVNTGDCSAWQTFNLINGGSGTIHVSSIVLGGTDPGEFQIQNNPVPCDLPPNATIDVRFCPTSDGVKSADLVITDDRAVTNIPLVGEGGTYAQGDICSNPHIVGALPWSHTDNTDNYTNTIGNESADVWYEFVVDHTAEYTATTCNEFGTFNTYLRLYADNCTTQIANNNDDCSGFSSSLSTIDCYFLDPGTYYWLVEGYSSYEGVYQIDICECFEYGACCDYSVDPLNPVCTDGILPQDCTDTWQVFHASPTGCADDPCITPCVICTENEGEPCGEDINGGCNMNPGLEYFTPLYNCDTICGTMWADNSTRDTDWYDMYLEEGSVLCLNIYSDIPWVMGMVEDSGGWGTIECPATSFYQYTTGARCTSGYLEIMTPGPSGHYIIWIGPSEFYYYPCGWWGGNNYQFTASWLLEPLLDPPENLSITIDGNNVVLIWDEVEDALGYYIYRSQDPYYFGAYYYDISTINSYTDINAAFEGIWFYYVTATSFIRQ